MTFPIQCEYHAPLEPPYSDYDEDGELVDVLVLSRKVHTARKRHYCDSHYCTQPILPGQRYRRKFVLVGNQAATIKSHLGCYTTAN